MPTTGQFRLSVNARFVNPGPTRVRAAGGTGPRNYLGPMTERRIVSSGSDFESAVGYSRAVRLGRHIMVAGTTASGPDTATQTREALRRIEVALREVGAAMSDVVRTRI